MKSQKILNYRTYKIEISAVRETDCWDFFQNGKSVTLDRMTLNGDFKDEYKRDTWRTKGRLPGNCRDPDEPCWMRLATPHVLPLS